MRNDYKIRPRAQMLKGGGIAIRGTGQALKKGGMAKGKFPDLNKDGKTTYADVITARMSKGKKGKMMKGKR
jgi:hypothetical protein